MAINNDEIKQGAIALVKNEKTDWETSTAFITERVSFQMRNLIRQLRKNYWGVFDNPFDPNTGREKIWTHLTKTMVENVVKNIDLDQKDINFRAKRPCAISDTIILRNKTKDELDGLFFGEFLDMSERTMAIDGTCVWKTWEDNKGNLRIRIVDMLNWYIDPTALSIQEAGSVIERHVMPVDEFKKMKLDNLSDITGSKDVNRIDGDFNQNMDNSRGSTNYVEVYERWGKAPLSLFTGKEKDADTQVDSCIIVSKDGNTWKLHKLEKQKTPLKPYEEAWYTRVPTRWYGEGVAERVMMEQLYMNIVRNTRINRHLTSQQGIFKMRRGSGITPQILQKMSANGVIPVNSMDDIEQLIIKEASQSSYTDEQNSESWARKLTSAFEVVTGESLPASTTATTSAITQQGASSEFTMIKEGFGMFLQRWYKRHALPIISKQIKVGDVVRCSKDLDKLDKQIRRTAENMIARTLNMTNQKVDQAQYEQMVSQTEQKLRENGKDIFVKVESKIIPDDFDVEVYVTNETLDKAVIAQNLVQMLPIAPEFKEQIVQQVFDIFGLDFNVEQKSQVQPEQLPGAQGVSQTEAPTNQEIVTGANTMGAQR